MLTRHRSSRTKPLALASLLACMCDADSDSDGTCDQRSGTYRDTFVERSGNCGPIPESVTTIASQPIDVARDVAPCTSGQILYSADNCEVTNVDIMCPQDGVAPGATSTTNGKYDWDEAGDHGVGTLNLVIRDSDGQVICQSSYDLSSVRL